jgi:Flp pilus assembly CpaF family ATPase
MTLAVHDKPSQLRHESLMAEMAPIWAYYSDPLVNEIMLNVDGRICVERSGSGMALTDATMAPHQADSLLKTVAAIMRSKLGPENPSLQGHLAGGIRIQGLLPPVVDQPIFAIRKPSTTPFTLESLAAQGVLPDQPANDFAAGGTSFAARWKKILKRAGAGLSLLDKLKIAADSRANIMVGGPTGSGKTAVAKALFAHMAGRRNDGSERFLVIQDTLEIPYVAVNQVNIRAAGDDWVFTTRQAVQATMRLRPDRIIVGEIKDGAAALELLKAWNTGHPGGFTTIHGDNAPGLLDRTAQLIEEVQTTSQRRLIAEAVNVLLYIERDGRLPAGRAVNAAAVVEGVNADGSWQLAPL